MIRLIFLFSLFASKLLFAEPLKPVDVLDKRAGAKIATALSPGSFHSIRNSGEWSEIELRGWIKTSDLGSLAPSGKIQEIPVNSDWTYSESEDAMTSAVSKYATIQSINDLNFGPPYAGAQKATLMVRKHPRHGTDIIISIEKGQFKCSYPSCSVNVRFDSDKPFAVTMSEPQSNSSTALFFGSVNKLLGRMKTAKKMLVEAVFYDQGSETLEFNVSGLNWK